jgi:hypothetical protein
MTGDPEDAVARLTEICLALPEAVSERSGRHVGYAIGKKKFAWYLDDHHGDGIVALSCRLPPGENQELVRFAPTRLYLPAYMAHHGWIALRLDVGPVDWDEVDRLVRESYRLQAPKRLASWVVSGQ